MRTTDPEWVRGNEEHFMREWSDEGDSGETKEDESSARRRSGRRSRERERVIVSSEG